MQNQNNTKSKTALVFHIRCLASLVVLTVLVAAAAGCNRKGAPKGPAPSAGAEGGPCRADGGCDPGIVCNINPNVCGPASTAWAVTVVMAGDIAEAGRTSYARGNADLIANHTPPVSAVFLLGDNARYGGSGGLLSFINTYYAPVAEANWGQFDTIVFPLPGNHEYVEPHAQGYFDYFANRMSVIQAMDSYHGFINIVGKGYYSFDLNGWHFVGLNSNCDEVTNGGCSSGGEQETWLKSDLAAHAAMPIIARWHTPRYVCGGEHEDDTTMQALWADLYDGGVDFVFVGHNHHYQRWKPLNKADPNAMVDLQNGLTQIVVGSTGVTTYSVCSTIDERVARQIGDDAGIGVFFLTIKSDASYAFEYRLLDGSMFDSGAGVSHHTPKIPNG
jgi:hypothetical protein